MDNAAVKKQLSSKVYNYLMQGYNQQQADALAKKDLGIEDTLPPPRKEINKDTFSKPRYPEGHFDEVGSGDRIVSRFDIEAQSKIGKPFSGQYAEANPQLNQLLKSKNLTPEEFFNLKKLYQKKGMQKSDEDIAQELFSSKQHFSKERARQTLQSMPRHPGIKSPQELAQAQPGQKVDPKQRISKLRVRKEDLIKMAKMNLTEAQIRTIVKNTVVLAERKRYAKAVIKEHVKEQRRVSRLIESIIKEQENAGIWGGIKNAIGSAAQAFGIGQSTAKDTGMQQAQNELVKGIKQAQSVRQKFNSQIMKNAELVNQYHDSVMGVLQVFQQVGQALGPNAQKIGEEINQLLGQFHRDLESEKQGIDTYLQSLTKAAPEAKKVADKLNKAAAEGPQVGPGKTQVTQNPGFSPPSTAMSPGNLYKGQPGQNPGQNQMSGGSYFDKAKEDFRRFVTGKYGQETLMKMPEAALEKAFVKYLQKKHGSDAAEKYRTQSGSGNKGKSTKNSK